MTAQICSRFAPDLLRTYHELSRSAHVTYATHDHSIRQLLSLSADGVTTTRRLHDDGAAPLRIAASISSLPDQGASTVTVNGSAYTGPLSGCFVTSNISSPAAVTNTLWQAQLQSNYTQLGTPFQTFSFNPDTNPTNLSVSLVNNQAPAGTCYNIWTNMREIFPMSARIPVPIVTTTLVSPLTTYIDIASQIGLIRSDALNFIGISGSMTYDYNPYAILRFGLDSNQKLDSFRIWRLELNMAQYAVLGGIALHNRTVLPSQGGISFSTVTRELLLRIAEIAANVKAVPEVKRPNVYYMPDFIDQTTCWTRLNVTRDALIARYGAKALNRQDQPQRLLGLCLKMNALFTTINTATTAEQLMDYHAFVYTNIIPAVVDLANFGYVQDFSIRVSVRALQAWPQTYSFPGRAPDPANPSAPLPGEAPGRFSLPGGNTTGQLRAVWDTPLGKAAVACIAIGSFMTVSMLGCCVCILCYCR